MAGLTAMTGKGFVQGHWPRGTGMAGGAMKTMVAQGQWLGA